MLKLRNRLFLFLVTTIVTSCTLQYGMIDGSIDADTFSVALFEEQAPNAPAGYGAVYTDFLKDYLISRTRLSLKNEGADIEIYGKVINYNTSPVSIQNSANGGDAAYTRLTVSLNVTVINNRDEKQSFEQNFSQFSDFDATQELSSVEDELLLDINDKLSQDIINKLTSNW
jgi:hypothetical protein